VSLPVTSRLGWGLALILVSAALFADFLSTNPPDAQDLDSFFAPPTRIRFTDAAGTFHLRPFVYRCELADALNVRYVERTERPIPLEFFASGWEYRLWGWLPCSRHLVRAGAGGSLYLLGADELGRDVLSRTLAGARTSLVVVLAGVLLAGLIGLALGGLAGMAIGWVDSGVMRASEFVLALPALYLILALRAVLPLHIPYWKTLALMVGTIALVAWPPMARGVRGLLLQLRSAGHIEAARGLGASEWHLFRRHMLPALAPVALAQAALAAPIFLLGEVLLSYLGVGFQSGDASWGTMLQGAKDMRIVTNFWWNLAPLPLVFLTLLVLNGASTASRAARGDRELGGRTL
jgi:peptide/nickel transport system permease protein